MRVAERSGWGYGASEQAPTQGRAHGGQVLLKKTSSDKYHFNLVAANGQVIATSQTYETKANAVSGIESVKQNAPTAEIDDQTDQ